jgi:hypothetical protein
VSFTNKKKEKASMCYKNTTDANDYQYHHIVIGDVLLHSEIKSVPIQIIIEPLLITPSQTLDKSDIPRFIPSRSEVINNQTGILCDLKNPTVVKLNHEQTLPSTKVIHIYKAGWTFVKELKSKISTLNTNSNNE